MNSIECKICGDLILKNRGLKRFASHLQSHGLSLQGYYDVCLKVSGDGVCGNCEKPTAYTKGLNGYTKYCSRTCAQESISSRPESKARHSETMTSLVNNPEFQKLATAGKQTDEARMENSLRSQQRYETHPHLRSVSRFLMLQLKSSEEIEKKRIEGIRQSAQAPEFKAKARARMIQNNLDAGYLRKAMAGAGRKEINGLEKRVFSILEKEAPGLFGYTGDFKIRIGRNWPDFVAQEARLVVEAFGDYWHDPEDETIKVEYYSQHGYSCLVLWEHESDQDMARRVTDFLRCVSAVVKPGELLELREAAPDHNVAGNGKRDGLKTGRYVEISNQASSKEDEGSETRDSSLTSKEHGNLPKSARTLEVESVI